MLSSIIQLSYKVGDFMEKLENRNNLKANPILPKKIWLSHKIFEDYLPCIGGKSISSVVRKRAYDLWNHANNLIQNATTDFQLEDGIIDLKRALNHRLKLIEQLYGFKKNISAYKNIPYLEILEKLSIIKPSLLKKLLIIRNNIEHNDFSAPEQERCLELSDVVWYFLKSTDQMCNLLYNDIECLDEDNDNCFFSIKIDYEKNFTISMRGLLNKKDLSSSYRDSYLELDILNDFHDVDTNYISFHGIVSQNLIQKEFILKFLFNICI